MAFLAGSGDLSDPYIINTAEAFKQFWEVDSRAGKHAAIIADLDCSGVPITNPSSNWTGWLDGYGRTVTGANISGGGSQARGGQIKRLTFDALTCSVQVMYLWNTNGISSEGFFVDVVFTETCNAGGMLGSAAAVPASHRVVKLGNVGSFTYANEWADCYTLHGTQVVGTDLREDPDIYNPDNYPALTVLPEIWVLDGSSHPRLLHQSVDDLGLGSLTHITGTTKINGTPAQRRARALSPVHGGFIYETLSDETTGEYELNTSPYTDHVLLVIDDDYGKPPQPDHPYEIGDIIHPPTPNGYRYRCAVAGNSGSELPGTWPTEDALVWGGTSFAPLVLAEPEVVGPLIPEPIVV